MVLKEYSKEKCMGEAEDRKQKSIEILKKYSVPYIDHLPTIETAGEISLRPIEEIAKRAGVLLIIAGYAGDVIDDRNLSESKEFFYAKLEHYGLTSSLSKREKEFFDNDYPTKKEAFWMNWQYESCYVLLWSLGLVNTLFYPDKTCSEGTISYLLAKCNTFKDFFMKTKLRDVNEILDETDLTYRYHWAVVDANVHNVPAPSNLHPDVVFERLRALNWLTGYKIGDDKNVDDWDDVGTDS